ncbi:ABC transporter ATP-binding protein [Aquabacterium sp. CECT 9606]|uniref:ABC transporter ATP-binding protein n=1 Tax=Aquabacterium sp. CECT 9606 TaxID=2845822 RepID=UPI001E473FBA|nr:ABC transporter ATP-binding protein [Aquabacterium sp. CECT 9606]CAH0347894.1 Nitrate import ATP-binding protein NrtD [Aquabacterium sp. CECT 9606]
MRPPASLSLSDIDFSHADGQPVFRGLNLAATPGEFVALLGPSGCGKSTLLNLLSGFLSPDQGSVRVNAHAVYPEMPELGYVFQSPQLFPWLNALDNVRFGLKMAGTLSPQDQITKALHYLQLVGLKDAAHKWPHQLSGGMRQRVSLARALAPEPALLLADEPFAALDAMSRRHMNEELLRLCSELGQTVVFVTHDIDEAVFLADRVVVLGRAPHGIDSEVCIDLPRPRRVLQTSRLPRFLEYRDQLLDRIDHVTKSHA